MIGVILLNMGGPSSLADVEPFLINLFSDREIIRLGPKWMQGFLARRIAAKRAPKSRAAYQGIGGGSPLTAISMAQAKALSERLAQHGEFTVTCAMRYWHPMAEQAVREIRAAGAQQALLLPLYPHYSKATSGSSIADATRALHNSAPEDAIQTIASWPTQPQYLAALAGKILEKTAAFAPDDVTLLYSAHSLPVRFIKEGDPYVRELQKTIDAVEKITAIPGKLCYQSRSGPVRWLSPSTPDTIRQCAEQGAKNILLVPLSFVSDHIETLYEIDIQYREMAANLGCRLERTESLNTDPLFIECLEKLVLSAVDSVGTDTTAGIRRSSSPD